ncbi:cache domain-containing sensor histidine kinase [Ruminiclostridium cellobioparum]|uniref:histidine kinase n=1 Tax=Ruminiclostridium cellobioparum subsp. termitidis CT1112 TaxID=1195236 RepID=S0FFB8_RUMCE|nr:sensor histidine kinase [Ruminiclostridium cellobioparum]EMS69157.1 multi-sensor signal transduction histidine kinase [Ruminiclostridium cellobioparum subsp. termitidis CT1112]
MNFFKKFSITTQLVINGLLTILIFVSMILLTYSQINNIIIKKNRNYTIEITSNIKQNMTTYYGEIKSMMNNLAYDPMIQNYIMEADPYELYLANKDLTTICNNAITVKQEIIDVVLLSDNGKYFSLRGRSEVAKSLRNTSFDDGKVHVTSLQTLQTPSSYDPIFIQFGMNVYSASSSKNYRQKIGYIAVLVDMKPIFKEINKFSSNTEIKYYLIDKAGGIYSENDPLNISDKPYIFKDVINNKNNIVNGNKVTDINGSKNLVLVYDIPEIESKIISFVPEKELFSEVSEVRKKVIFFLVIANALLAVLFLLIIRNITQPVKKLVNFMNSVKSGNIRNMKNKVQLEGYSEIHVLSHEFNEMMGEISNLTHRLLETSSKLYEAEIVKEKAELAFLRSQINPHFLYNTFEVIKGIASEENNETIYEMTRALAMIFRYSVNGSNEVLLDEEIKIIQAYVQINKIRFSERIDVFYEFSGETLNVTVLKMILQPIVENAIFHGLEPKMVKGRLWIGSRISEGKVIIWVKDDGMGIDAEQLQKMQLQFKNPSALEQPGTSKKSGIGLCNVNNRIKLTYGNEYGLSISSMPDAGTEVNITIPLRR